MTFLVAAYDAVQNEAHYTCDGVDDHVEIMQAINALPSCGGTVRLTEGHFNLGAPVVSDRDCVRLEGRGRTCTILQPMTGVDPTALLVIGQTQVVEWNEVASLCLDGKASEHASGDGLVFRSNGGKVDSVLVRDVPDDGVLVDGLASVNLYEVIMRDVTILHLGNDGLMLGNLCYDSDFFRVITCGGQQEPTPFGRYGIHYQGHGCKFIACHAYHCTTGFESAANGSGRPQIIGGDYETNEIGIAMHGQWGGIVHGIRGNANTNADVVIDQGSENVIMDGNLLISTQNKSLSLYDAHNCQIHGNVMTAAKVTLEGGSSGNLVQGNMVRVTPGPGILLIDAIGNRILDNVVPGDVVEQGASMGNILREL